MESIVMYDSKFGNTMQLAEAIGQELKANGPVKVLSVDSSSGELGTFDLLVVGGPTHAHGLSAPMRQFLDALTPSANGAVAAAFDTRYRMSPILSGSAAKVIAKRLGRTKFKLVAPPQSFFVTRGEAHLEDGELLRARAWAGALAAAAPASRRMAA